MTKFDKSIRFLFVVLKLYFICGFNVYLGNVIWLRAYTDLLLTIGHLVPAILSFKMQLMC